MILIYIMDSVILVIILILLLVVSLISACVASKFFPELSPFPQDHAGMGYCPYECVGRVGGLPGSCNADGTIGTPLDGECSLGTDCAGWQDGINCCKGTCRQMEKDYIGVLYCPHECIGAFGDGPGTCGSTSGDVSLSGTCETDTNCMGYEKGEGTVKCCNGTCQTKQLDWAGAGYCPHECVGTSGGKPGTCNEDGTIGTATGGECTLHTDCYGWGPGTNDAACCEGKCVQKVKDWAGVGYCPHECTGWALAPGGTCVPGTVSEEGSCTKDTECAGYGPNKGDMGCCGGKCAKKQKSWNSTITCPSECVGRPGGKKGQCTDEGIGVALGGECKLGTDCNGGTNVGCCNSKCERKYKDWAGVPYCQFECVADGWKSWEKGKCTQKA